jgi:putative multicomponent Na+:H+ antiporter subunit B
MMEDAYIYVITALLPLSALMVVVQKNPYHALVIRGILGAVAALVYAVLGAADVALTEALVGTMLAITLYAVAVRSSLNMRLGILDADLAALEAKPSADQAAHPGDGDAIPAHADAPGSSSQALTELMGHLRTMLKKRHLRLELVPFPDIQAMEAGLLERDIHGFCIANETISPKPDHDEFPSYGIITRIRRLYDLMQAELPILAASVTYVPAGESPLPTVNPSNSALSPAEEVHP